MATILESVGQMLTPDAVGQIGKAIGVDSSLVQQGLNAVEPTILGSLSKTANTPGGADAILKATNVDGIYSADPRKDPKARKFKSLTFLDAINRRLKVMDTTALTLCMENKLPILVFDLRQPGNILKAVRGEAIGTIVKD